MLWNMIKDKDEKFDFWTKTSEIFHLNPEEMEKEVKDMEKTANKLINFSFGKNKKFKDPLEIAKRIHTELKDFKDNIILARVFSNKGLKDRHWKEIYDVTGLEI